MPLPADDPQVLIASLDTRIPFICIGVWFPNSSCLLILKLHIEVGIMLIRCSCNQSLILIRGKRFWYPMLVRLRESIDMII